MTHKDIYDKFMIEYDKANITSSYPSLTKYEVATFLDKAYLAIIAQKLTGNNIRRKEFEGDVKAVEDLRPLVAVSDEMDITWRQDNEFTAGLPEDFLYYIDSVISGDYGVRIVNLVSHNVANKFKVTRSNYPWVKEPVMYVDEMEIHILVDPDEVEDTSMNKQYTTIVYTYIKTPNPFVKATDTEMFVEGEDFELSDEMAEELINLAIIFATEVTESPRMQSKVSINAFES